MSTVMRYPPPVPVRTTPRPSLIHWPIVATAGAGAVVFMAGTLAAAWFASRAAGVPKERPAPVVQAAVSDEAPALPTPPEAPAVPPAARPAETVTEETKAPDPEPLPPPSPPACDSFGTRVLFVSNPTDAARLARQDNKLLFVLHISGNFEDDKFT